MNTTYVEVESSQIQRGQDVCKLSVTDVAAVEEREAAKNVRFRGEKAGHNKHTDR